MLTLPAMSYFQSRLSVKYRKVVLTIIKVISCTSPHYRYAKGVLLVLLVLLYWSPFW